MLKCIKKRLDEKKALAQKAAEELDAFKERDGYVREAVLAAVKSVINPLGSTLALNPFGRMSSREPHELKGPLVYGRYVICHRGDAHGEPLPFTLMDFTSYYGPGVVVGSLCVKLTKDGETVVHGWVPHDGGHEEMTRHIDEIKLKLQKAVSKLQRPKTLPNAVLEALALPDGHLSAEAKRILTDAMKGTYNV